MVETARGNVRIEHRFWVSVLAGDTLADGEMTPVQHGQRRLAIYHIEGQYFATDDIRTAAFDFLSDGYIENATVYSPRGEMCFDIRSGKGQGLTATVDLRTYPVRIDRGNVEVLLARYGGELAAMPEALD